jgi:stage II sporulation protein AA (anti-sigma F factor antagonist)
VEESPAGAEVRRLSGRLGAPTVAALTRVVDEALAAGTVHLRLDCSRVEYVSSAGLAALEHAAERMRQAGGALVLRGLHEAVQVSLEVSAAGARLDWTDALP